MNAPSDIPAKFEDCFRPIAEQLENIFDLNLNIFKYQAQTTFAGTWEKLIKTDRLALRLQATILDALRLAEFHNSGDLQVVILQTGIRLSYTDAEYGFDFEIRDDGSIVLTREGGSLRRFHDWYCRLMPSAAGILTDALAGLSEEIFTNTTVQREITIESVFYSFRIVAYNFEQQDMRSSDGTANFDLIKRTMALVPDSSGHLTSSEALSGQDFARVDTQVSRWRSGFSGTRTNDVYRVEAPSNSEYSSLWFTFMTGGQTFIGARGQREPMDVNSIVSPVMTASAYVDFFRDRALGGFLADISSGYDFATTPGRLP